jgi:hypothetical protein
VLVSRSEKPMPPVKPSARPKSMRAEGLMAVSLGSSVLPLRSCFVTDLSTT